MNQFYKKFFILMLPMALKELISSLTNLVDTIMIGRLGDAPIAAIGIGNQVYFLFTVFLFGISCGAGVFSSQFWGKQDIPKMRKILGLNLLLAMGLALVFMFAAVTFPVQIFNAFKAAPEALSEGVTYLRIVCIGYFATAITTAFDSSVCCSEKAALPFIVRAIGLLVNVVLNWILIFGRLGAPAMGVKGAAVATVIARFSELAVMLSAVYGRKMIQAASFKELFTIPKEIVVKFFKTSSAVILNEMAWALGTTAYSWVFARISPEAIVVITIVQNIERLMLVFFHGGGNAGGVFIGKAVGAGNYEEAYEYGKRLAVLSVITSVVLSLIFVAARPIILMPYQVSAEVYSQSMNLLAVVAVMMNIKALTFLLIVGVFRNGGNPGAAFLIDIGCVWLVGVPMVTLGGLVLHLPLLISYAMMCSEEIVKVIISVTYFKKKKWMRNVVS